MSRFAVALCALLTVAPAWAINKCIASDGKVTYQREPCIGKGQALDIVDGNDALAAQAARNAE